MSKFNKMRQNANKASEQTSTAPPAPKTEEKAPVPIPKEGVPVTQMEGVDDTLLEMRDFVAENIVGIRPWANREGGMNATLRLRVIPQDQLPEGYVNVAEVATDLLESLVEIKDTTGIPTFADFQVTYDRTKKAQARIIKVNEDDNTLIAVLSIEYGVAGAKGSFIQAKSSQDNVEQNKPEEQPKKKFGFART